jgi:hypothetical protein
MPCAAGARQTRTLRLCMPLSAASCTDRTFLLSQLRMLHGSGMRMSMRGAPGRSKEDIMEEIRRLQAALLSHDGSRAPDTKDN